MGKGIGIMKTVGKSLAELHKLLVNKEISSVELTREYLDHIREYEPKIKAFITITEDEALKQAEEVDKAIAQGEEIGPLAGIPMALKDNLCTEGIVTTCASQMLRDFNPPYDATVVSRLKAAGAVLVGKLNMDEFAMGSSTENSGYFPTANPWDLSRVPGGSSGGSAASVAAGEVPYSLGSDTGGSIRQPAAFCGVVGLKPTYGAVSRYGLVAFASSLDQIGPLTRTVEDNALVLNAIAGHDPLDSTSVPFNKPDYTQFLENNVRGLKIGVPKEFFGLGLKQEVAAVIEQAIKTFEQLGAKIEECSLPHMEYALPAYYIIAPAECSSNLARYDGVSYGYRAEADGMIEMCKTTRAKAFGQEVKRRIMLGTYALSSGYYDTYYLKAQKVRTLVKQDFERVLAQYDILLSPTTPTVAYKLGEISDPVTCYMGDVYTIPVNLAGLPAISLPAGFTDGLPVGMQLIGNYFAEGLLYRAAYVFEQNTGYYKEIPGLLREAD